MISNARRAATEDIKAELRQEGKCFIVFRKELNAAIKRIIKKYSELQDRI